MENVRTLGRTSAQLISSLYDQNKIIFTINDVSRITGLDYFSAGRLISELKKRRIVSTLKKGKHIIIPQELGSIDKFIGNWYVAAREIVNSPDYYVAFYSAMKYWGMTTQPVLKIFTVTPKRQFVPQAMVGRISFIYVDKKYIWGVKEEWVTKTEKVRISDIEKTIIDALAHPEYCGGITEIAKGIWLVKEKINFSRLIEHAEKYNRNVVSKRLGYILELLGVAGENLLTELKKFVKNRYDLFDPTVKGRVTSKNNWRLLDNIGKEQILKIISH